MPDDEKLCQICETNPLGEGRTMTCDPCFTRIDDTARNNPYGWMDAREEA